MAGLKRQDDFERLAVLETEVKNVSTKLNTVENSVNGLHGKVDTLILTLTEKYVAKETFEEFKKARWLERALSIIITAIITGLIMQFINRGF